MTSRANKQLIEKIIQNGHGKSPAECRLMLLDLFDKHDVTSALVKEWMPEDFDRIKMAESDKPIKSARKRTPDNRHSDALSQDHRSRPATYYTDASITDVNEVLNRIGYPDLLNK